jgi:hypothetical protein
MDLYRIFKPVLFISRWFCLAPFAAVEDSGFIRYKFSKFWLLYSILGVCASSIVQINFFWILLSISDVFSQVSLTFPCVASVVNQILCLNNGKNVLRILDHVSALDSEHSGARISYCRLYKVFIVHLICCIISTVAPNILWIAGLEKNFVYIFIIFSYSTVCSICDVVLLLSESQFIYFVLLLKYRFSVLNDTVINFTVPSLYKTSLNPTSYGPLCELKYFSCIQFQHTVEVHFEESVSTSRFTVRRIGVCKQNVHFTDSSECYNNLYSSFIYGVFI